jgi:signal transduction histidine kinase
MSPICLYTERMNAEQPSIRPSTHSASLPLTLASTSAAVTEAQWVKSESIRRVVTSVSNTQHLMLGALVFMVIFLYGHASTPVLFTWFGINLFLSGLRFWILRSCSQSDKAGYIAQRDAYFQRYVQLIPFIGFVWGAAVYIFIETTAPNIAIASLLTVLIFGTFTVFNLSSYWRLLNRFIWAYGTSMFCAVVLHLAIVHNFKLITTEAWYLLMIVIFVYMQYRVGVRMNSTDVEALRLQYRNKNLIASLTEERETTLAAVLTKNRMLASAAHDMRQPVLALDLYAGWLAEDPTAAVNIAPKIAASTKSVINLFDSMFDMSRLTEGQVSTNLEIVDLEVLLYELFSQYHPIAKSKNLEFRTRVIQGTIFTDHILLGRILGNLISNALQYTQTGGILLACRNSKHGVKIEIWDTGIGIAPDQQGLVFKEFYKSQANPGTSEGFGLGLSIVAHLVDLIGAELTLKSRRGRGTVVSIQLGKTL